MNNVCAQAIIMIIDDEPDNLNVLGEMLRHDGWDVRAFPRGEMALAAAHDEPPDLVLLDIRMPGMDGYEVCRRFKADARLRAIPIIFLSAFAAAADKIQAFGAGGVDYVTKPFAAVEVLARSHTHLRLHRHQQQLEKLVRERVKELAEAHRRLRIWDDAKTQWLNMLSHEMRTPLTSIFGITELLFMELPPDSGHHDLRTIFDLSRERVGKLMDDALTLAQINVAVEALDGRPVRLAYILRCALDTFNRQVPVCEVRATIAAVEQTTVFVDSALLNRALINLLQTAACCVGAGESIMLEALLAAGQAKVLISTAGKPLPPEAVETFFDVGGQRMLFKGGGDFGLGAALAGRILRLFNGSVAVRNGSEQGIVMEILLPTDHHTPPMEGTER